MFGVVSRRDLVLDKGIVASGAFGIVCKATWKPNKQEQRTVAVKKVSVKENKLDRKKILNEVEILSQLEHQNIIRIYGACFEQQELWIVTDFIEGYSLYELLHEQNFMIQWDTLLSWALQAADAVCALHSHQSGESQIVHRDIKSLNFMVTKDLSTMILIDFGFAKFTNVVSNGPRKNATPRWGAPETLDYPPCWTPAADIYSLGCTFYEMVAHKIPYYEADDDRIKLAVQGPTFPEIPNSCPEAFAKMIRECWDCNPKNRPTADQLKQQLVALSPNTEIRHRPTRSNTETILIKELSLSTLFRFNSFSSPPTNSPSKEGFTLPKFGKTIRHMLLGKDAKVQAVKSTATMFLSGMTISLLSDAVVEFSRGFRSWALSVTPCPELSTVNTKVFHGSENLLLLKNKDIEQGLSVLNTTLQHFFVLPVVKPFTLRFKPECTKPPVTATTAEASITESAAISTENSIVFDLARTELQFFDQSNNFVLAYKKPFFTDSKHRRPSVDVRWLSDSNDMVVTVPSDVTPPLILSFPISYSSPEQVDN